MTTSSTDKKGMRTMYEVKLNDNHAALSQLFKSWITYIYINFSIMSIPTVAASVDILVKLCVDWLRGSSFNSSYANRNIHFSNILFLLQF